MLDVWLRRSLLLLAFPSAVTTCAFSFAGIDFQTTRVERKAEIGSAEMTVEYRFDVTGDAPLVIENVDTGCGCAQDQTDKKQYPPGGTGSVKVKVNIGDREGLYQTPMLVHWRQADQKSTQTLFVQIEIPVIASFSQRVLIFTAQERSKSLTIDVPSAVGLKFTVGESVGGYEASLKRSDSRRYDLSVRAGDELRNGYVDVIAQRDKVVIKKWRIFLRIRS